MKVILREDVPDLGAIGELVNVKDGYARNFLLPQGLAVTANEKNARQVEHQKRLIERRKLKVQEDASALAERIKSVSCTIPVLVGEQDKLFGSVTSKDIEEALSQEGLKISRRQILLEEPIKNLGVYTIDVRLHPEVTGKLKVWIVAKYFAEVGMDTDGAAARLPPQNLEAERSVLGGVLLDNTAMDQILDLLEEEDFYREAHRKVYSAMRDMAEKGEAIDYLTLEDRLKARGQLTETGGSSYLASLTDAVPSAANILHYARIVRDKAVARRLIHASTEILQAGFDDSEHLDEYLDRAEQLIFSVSQKRAVGGVTHIKELVRDSFDAIERLYERKETYTGVPSGFLELDEKTSGFQRSDLIIIAARPSMGKTSLALNIAQYAAQKVKTPTLVFSLEMSKESLAMRLLCAEGRVDFHRLRQGILTDSEWGRLARAAGSLSEAQLYIDDTPAIRVMEMRAKARRLQAALRKQQLDLGMLVMDYMQLASAPRSSDNREREISEISRSLKGLAKELNIPVIALSQLSRKPEGRESKRPQLSDLRESGAIEQDADVILFIYRDEMYNENTDEKGIAEVIIGKQRNGPTGTVRLRFFPEHTRFENYARDRDAT